MNCFIDTHCHVYDNAFKEDFDDVITRMKEAGISACIMPGIDISSYDSMIETSDRLCGYAYPCIGLHPTSVGDNWEEELRFVKEHLKDRRFYAIGEIGMDEYWTKDFVKEQKNVFGEQIEMALRNNLPIIIHCRDAFQDTMSVISDFRGGDLKGVFHAYSGSYESYKELVKFGDFKIGIGGVLTYKKAGIAEVVKKIPIEDIILETDCPWLTPVPFRGHRNEPSYIPYIAARLSEVTGISIDHIAKTTTNNAKHLFRI